METAAFSAIGITVNPDSVPKSKAYKKVLSIARPKGVLYYTRLSLLQQIRPQVAFRWHAHFSSPDCSVTYRGVWDAIVEDMVPPLRAVS